jgi:uncharacterized protein YhdP
MRATVRPEIGGAAAMGVALAHPVAGVATLLANTILRDPLNRLFSYHYRVTGSWDDPKVDKVPAANQASPSSEEGNKP